ncbi:MAG: hypothetical protein KGM96_03290 [Acidobacteriota bacterium]|nr:hypothetical protein [Acidobacteriota bacterium]
MALANLTCVPFTPEQVAIAVSHSPMGAGHIGIGFHAAKSGPQVLHLAWHRKLEVDDVPAELKQCWAAEPFDMPHLAAKQLVAFVRAVAKRGATINYAIDFIASKGSFDPNGTYRPPKGSSGLTCASFVLEVFRGGSIPLVQIDTWREDPANVSWGNAVCDWLARDADPDHVAAVRKSVRGLRLRPFEVAGACRLTKTARPASFDAVQGPAAQIEAELPKICPAVPLAPSLLTSPPVMQGATQTAEAPQAARQVEGHVSLPGAQPQADAS